MERKNLRYFLKKNRFESKAGTEVYKHEGHDYGLASMDTFYLQKEHICVKTDPTLNVPFFSVALEDLEIIEDE